MELHIDIETFSPVPITEAGVFRYAEHPQTEVLIIATKSGNGAQARLVPLQQTEWVQWLVEELNDPDTTKVAHNVHFEFTVLRAWLTRQGYDMSAMDIANWVDTMAMARRAGLPGSLEKVAETLDLANQKDKAGKALINYFSAPCKPTKKNGYRTRNLPHHDPDRFELFEKYCVQDVETEAEIFDKLQGYIDPRGTVERAFWELDFKINDRGIPIDVPYCENAVTVGDAEKERITAELAKLTGISPFTAPKFREWLAPLLGVGVSLAEESRPALIEKAQGRAKQALILYELIAKTAGTKYAAALECVCADGRVRGTFAYHGAHTGRDSGRLLQPQNMPRIYRPDIAECRADLAYSPDWFFALYDKPVALLSELVRPMIHAAPGKTLVFADWSAIEARITAWLAGERWRLDAFTSGADIYKASASQMFGVSYDKIDKAMRQKGKVSELALGYNGSTGALLAMGALKMGLAEHELPGIVALWRKASPAIVRLWRLLNDACARTVQTGQMQVVHPYGGRIVFSRNNSHMHITLPSGRHLAYFRPRLDSGGDGVVYLNSKGGETRLYGGIILENIVQAISADILRTALLAFDAHPLLHEIIMRIHDEIGVEVPEAHADEALAEACRVMCIAPSWIDPACPLPLNAAGYVSKFYKKD